MTQRTLYGVAALTVGVALAAASAAGIAQATDAEGNVHVEVNIGEDGSPATADTPSSGGHGASRPDAPATPDSTSGTTGGTTSGSKPSKPSGEGAASTTTTSQNQSTGDSESQPSQGGATTTDGEDAGKGDQGASTSEDSDKCVPSEDPSTFEVARYPNPDGTLTIKGKGWCTTDGANGGSKIAFKIDEGKIARLNTHINSNDQVWGIVEADPKTGDWEYKMVLPDGTDSGENGSNPPLSQGAHKIRMLSGSLKDGDVSRTRPAPKNDKEHDAATFIIGDYAPNGDPDPLSYDKDLTDAGANGVSVEKSDSELKVTIPNASKGDWVYLSAYKEDGSPRNPWSEWFQADDNGVVTAPLEGVNLPSGKLKIVAQNGNPSEVGKLIGWAWLDVPKKEKPAKNTDGASGEQSGGQNKGQDSNKKAATKRSSGRKANREVVEYVTLGGADGTTKVTRTKKGKTTSVTSEKTSSKSGSSSSKNTSKASASGKKKPTKDPKSPVKKATDLNNSNRGSVTASAKGSVLTATIKDGQPGDWVFVYTYDPKPLGLGWVQLDDDKKLTIDAAGLPSGKHKFAFIGEDGKMLGWADIQLTSKTSALEQNIQEDDAQPASFSPPLMSGTDWILIIAALAVVELAIIGMFLRKNRIDNKERR